MSKAKQFQKCNLFILKILVQNICIKVFFRSLQCFIFHSKYDLKSHAHYQWTISDIKKICRANVSTMCDSELLSIPSKLNKQNKLDFTAPPLGQSSTLQDLTSSFMIVLPQTVLLVVTPVSQSPLGLHGLQSSTTEIVQQVITLLLFITQPKHLQSVMRICVRSSNACIDTRVHCTHVSKH